MTDKEIIDLYDNTDLLKKRKMATIKDRYPDIYNYLTTRFTDLTGEEKISELIYRTRFNITEHPKCIICGKPLKFYASKCIYDTKFCSKACEHTKEGYEIKKALTDKTKLERYGDKNYNNRDKYKQTNIKKFGFTNPNMNSDIKEKALKTRTNTVLEKYGVTNVMFLDKFKDKVKLTNQLKYGVSSVMQLDEFKDKVKLTTKEKYGVISVMQLDEFKDKVKQTMLDRYGVDNPQKSKEIKEKTILTLMNRYGVDNPQRSKEIKEKTILTNLKKYGVINPMLTKEILNKAFESRFLNSHGGTSKIEDITFNFILQYIDNNVKRQYISDDYPFHCDFFCPKYNLYIELNGIWTHNDHPYDENNIYDIEIVNKWKEKAINSNYYKAAIKTWTIDDVCKRNTAKNKNLNFIEIYSNDINIISEKITLYINEKFTNI